MKINKKIKIIIGIVLVIGIGIFVFMVKNNYIILSKEKTAIGVTDHTKKSYGYPCISLVSYSLNTISVDAGIYRFGDVTQDGIIDKKDADAIKVMISFNDAFTKDQIKLADIDEDGKITNTDLKLFNIYLEKNPKVKYDTNSKYLTYCLTKTNDSSTCNWQDSSSFKITQQEDYYVFVMNKTNNVVSTSRLFDKSNMNRNLSE